MIFLTFFFSQKTSGLKNVGDSTAMLLNHDTERPYLTLPQCPERLTWNTSELNVTTSTTPLGYFSSSHDLPR